MIPLHSRTFRLALLALTALIVYTLVLLLRAEGNIAQRWAQSNLAWDFGSNKPAHQDESGITGAIAANIDFGRVTNTTLGFEKVFAIGLRERTDKRDALALMAALTGFDIVWIDGVKPGDIPDKAIPFGIEVSAVHDNFLGSWRGHMDAIRQ
jgi:hypothetical protein